jgi:hypothetical protein
MGTGGKTTLNDIYVHVDVSMLAQRFHADLMSNATHGFDFAF